MAVNPIATGYGPSVTRTQRILFDGDERNFTLWETKFLGYMRIRNLHQIFKDLDNDNFPVDENKNEETYAELVQVLDDRSLSLIMRDAKDDGRKALKILRNHYRPTGKPRVITLYTQLTSLAKKKQESITDYIIRAETAASCLRDAGEVISDSLLVAMVLKGLPNEFQPFVTVMTQRDKTLTFSDFKVALRNHEDTDEVSRRHSQTSSSTNVMSFKHKRWCQRCKSSTHDTSFCRKAQPPTPTNSQTRQGAQGKVFVNYKQKWCEICENKTHSTSDCRKLSKLRQVREIPDKSEDSEEHYYSFCLDQKSDQVDSFDNSNLTKLLVDSGASVHIVNDKTKFKNFTKDFNSSAHVIELADGSRNRSLALGQGDAEMNVLNSEGQLCSIILENALYVPSFAQNIFSVPAATGKGATIVFAENSAKLIQKDNSPSIDIHKERKLYFINSVQHSTKVSRTLKQWHEVLGHCNIQDLLKLQEKVEGMVITNKTDNFQCDVCPQGKMADSRSRVPDNSANAPFELVHIDLAGPIDPESIDGHK